MRIKVKKLKIPEHIYDDFFLLKKIESDKRRLLIQELRKLPPNDFELTPDRLNNIANVLNIERKELKSILNLIYEVFFVQYSKELETSIQDFLKELGEGIKDTKDDNIIPKDEEWEEYMEFWKSILTLDNTIGLLAKAREFKKDYQNKYLDSKIYTEIRPIFSRKIKTDIASAAILYHNLKIEYRQAFLPENFFLSLNPEDLRSLKKVIDRALEKEKSILKLFKQKELILIKNGG